MADVVDVGAPHESQRHTEAGRDAVVGQVVVEGAAVADQSHEAGGAVVPCAGEVGVVAADGLRVEEPVLVEAQVRRRSGDLVARPGERARGRQEPEIGLVGEVAAQAADDVDGAILELGARRIRFVPGRAIVDHQRARRPLAVLAGHPRAELRIAHAP